MPRHYARLLGVPQCKQGEDDSFCVLYSMSMMLGALFPQTRWDMADSMLAFKSKHPIARSLRVLAPKRADYYRALGEWAGTGVSDARASKLLNAFVEAEYPELATNGPFFQYRSLIARSHDGVGSKVMYPREVVELLDQGLPVLCGGEDEAVDSDLSLHTVLIVGYDHDPSVDGAKYPDFVLHDPGKAEAAPTESSKSICLKETGHAGLIFPAFWPDLAPRLDRVELVDDECFISRWDGRRYVRWQADASKEAQAG